MHPQKHIHKFIAKLTEPESGPATSEFAERLYGIASDLTCVSRNGTVFVECDRDATSLEQAIRSAIADIVQAGGTVESVEIEKDEIAQLLNG